MNAIVAVDENWGIGKKNGLLFELKKDMQFFRQHTLNKVVVVGSNTLKSFPNSKPLPKRTNIVLYPNGEKRDDCIVVGSLDDLFEELKKYDTDDVFVIGGAMLYRTLLDYCKVIYVTKVRADGNAEMFFENLDERSNWSKVDESELTVDNGYVISFCTYQNTEVKKYE